MCKPLSCHSFATAGRNANPHGASAQQYGEALVKISEHSLTADTELCKTMSKLPPPLSRSFPGIQTEIETNYSSAPSTHFMAVPIGYVARQRNYTPEMKTMSTRLDAIAHAVLSSFGVVGARSAVNHASVYHSSDEFDAQAAGIRKLGAKYRHTMLCVLESLSDARAHIKIPTTVAHLLAGSDAADTLANHRTPIKLQSSIDLTHATELFNAK